MENQNVSQANTMEPSKMDSFFVSQDLRGSSKQEQYSDILKEITLLDELIDGKSQDDVIQIRQKQLGLAKYCFEIYEALQDKLVISHTNLGDAYLNNQCFEQAIEHLTTALKLNGNLFSSHKFFKEYHVQILILLGRSYIEMGNVEDGFKLLIKAQEILETLNNLLVKLIGNAQNLEIQETEENINQIKKLAQIYTLKASAFKNQGDFQQALMCVEVILRITNMKQFQNNYSQYLAYIEGAKIYELKVDYENAIEYQENAVKILEKHFDYPEQLAQQYEYLCTLYEKIENIEGHLQASRKIESIYTQIFGPTDPRVLKFKRTLALLLLDNEKYDESLKELYELEDLETRIYGYDSVQVAKSQKVIGTILILQKENLYAQEYLEKSLAIFEKNKMTQQVQDVKNKLNLINQQHNNE